MTPENRRYNSLRYHGFDYSEPGAYFITCVTKDRTALFGEIENGEMILNEYGEIASRVWQDLPGHYNAIQLDVFCIMPDHMHAILIINEPPDEKYKPVSLSEIVRAFKTYSAHEINRVRGISGIPVWQQKYIDHIIRDDRDYENIKGYILDNPYRKGELKIY
jgi:putative transposase